jgi:hypothetical protein
MYKTVLIVLLALLINGCASNAPKFNEAKINFDSVDPNNGRVYLYRPSKFLGGGVTPKLILNDTSIGEIEDESFFFIDRPEGEYHIESSVGALISNTNPENQLDFSLAKGETKYIKFAMTRMGLRVLLGWVVPPIMHPEVVNKEDALTDLSQLPYIASSVK